MFRKPYCECNLNAEPLSNHVLEKRILSVYTQLLRDQQSRISSYRVRVGREPAEVANTVAVKLIP